MSTEIDRRKKSRQRRSKLPVAVESSPLRGDTSEDAVWIPPKAKDRRGVEVDEEATVEREERGDSQRRRHSALLHSMDLIVDGKGFLVPRKCKKAADDSTVDNELVLFDEGDDESSSESSSSSSSDDSSSDEDPSNKNELSLSSIPYCKLVPDSFDNAEVPQTPGHNRSRNLKSYSTLATEALTRTTVDSKSEIFSSPNSSFNHFQSPRPQPIPESCQVQRDPWDFISPIPDPSPSGRRRGKPKISHSTKLASAASSPVLSKELSQSLDTFYIPGITGLNKSATSNTSQDSRSSDQVSARNNVIHSPVISTSRISSATKKIGGPPFLAHKSPSQPTRLTLHRHRSDSTAINHQSPLLTQSSVVRGIQRGQSESAKDSQAYSTSRQRSQSKDRHFVPENVEEILLRSPNVVPRQGPSINRYPKSPMKTPSSSSRGTSTTTGVTLTNSTGRASVDAPLSTEKQLIHIIQDGAANHRNSAATVSSIETDFNIHVHLKSAASNDWNSNQIIVDQVPAVNLDGPDDDDHASVDEISEAGAVVVKTRKVLRSTSQRAKQRSRSRSTGRQHRREKTHR